MAGAVIGALRVNLGMDSAQFQRGLKNVSSGMSRFARVARTTMLAVGAATTAAAAGLAVAVRSTISYADATAKTADRIGWQIEQLQRLRHAADLTGVSTNTLDMAMQRFSRRVGEAVQGSGELRSTLEQYGIAVTDAEGRTRDQVDILADLADVIANAESEQEQLRIAFKAFDSEGAALVNTLRGGSGALREMMNEADRLGIVISTQTARRAEAFNDAMTRFQGILQGVVFKITEAVMPALNNFANTLSSPAFAEGAAKIGIAIVESMNAAANAIMTVSRLLDRLNPKVDSYAGGSMASAFPTQYGAAINQLQEDLGRLQSGSSANMPIWGFVENFPFDNIRQQLSRLGDSFTSTFSPAASGAEAAAEAVDLVGDSVTGLTEKTQTFGEMAFDAFKGMGSQLADAFFKGGNIAKNVLDVLIDRVGRLADMLIDQAFNLGLSALFKVLSGGGGGLFGGLLGGIFGGGGGYTPGFGAMFASGGFTGFGGMHEPAGIVHKGEYVLSAAATRNIGLDNLDAMNAGMAPGGQTVVVPLKGSRFSRADIEEWVAALGRETKLGLKIKLA